MKNFMEIFACLKKKLFMFATGAKGSSYGKNKNSQKP